MISYKYIYALKQALFMACFAFVLCPSVQAFAQSDLYNRLSRIERDMQTLSKSVYKGDDLPAHMLGSMEEDQKYRAQTDVRLNDLETQIRTLRGEIEQFQFNLDTLNTRLETIENRPSVTHSMTEGNLGINNNEVLMTIDGATPSQAEQEREESLETTPTETLSVESSPTQSYERAFALLKEGDNARAQKGFEAFITNYPEDSLTDNARYWLGETYYVQNEYDKAARIFADAYQKAPKGPKAADNLLKLGLSLSGLGRKEHACVSFEQLDKEFGQTSSAIVRRGEQERTTLECE